MPETVDGLFYLAQSCSPCALPQKTLNGGLEKKSGSLPTFLARQGKKIKRRMMLVTS